MATAAQIKAKKAFRKLNKARLAGVEASGNTVAELAQIGKYFAKSIAPYNTGRVAKMIKTFTSKKGLYSFVISANPPNHYWNDQSVVKKNHGGSVVKFLQSVDYQNSPKGYDAGGYQYMKKTRNYLNSRKTGVAQVEFDRRLKII